MNNNLESFVIEMSENSTAKANYIENPQLTMEKAGLDEEVIQMVLSGDKKKISECFGGDSEMVITGIIHLVPNAKRH